MRRRFFLLFFLLLTPVLVFGQSGAKGTISGFVYDDETGEALIGANVFLQGTYFGSSTNTSGFFALPKVPVGKYTLICDYMGFEQFSKEIKISIDSQQPINILLKPTTIETQAVSVVADSVRTSVKLFQKPISKVQLNPRQIQRMPQVVEADLLRSLQALPGVMPISDYSSELYIRGGSPDQNLYLIDGADVYNPEHFMGLFSTFNTDAIKNVELYKGGFGAEYGGRLSSVLDVTNLDGNRREFQGKTSVSLLSAKTTLQLPIGKIGTISGSIRRTYFDQTVAKFLDDIPDYYFYDGHLKAYFDINSNNKLTISTFKSRDDLDFKFDEESSDSPELDYDWGNTTGSVRWTHIFSPQVFGNFWVTASEFESEFNLDTFSERNEMEDITLKGNLEYYYSQKVETKIGFEYKHLRNVWFQDFPGGIVDVSRKSKHFSSYLQANWQPTPLMDIETGLRYNFYEYKTREHDISPRISLKYRLTETTNIKAAFGSFRQYLFRIPRTFIVDIWANADEFYKGASSHHYILGFQREVANDYEFEIEAYYKDYDDIYTFSYFFYTDLHPTEFNSEGVPVYRESKGIFNQLEGHSVGIEFLLRKDSGPVSGWLAYTLGRTEYKSPTINQGDSFVPRHDRTSTVNLVGNMDIRNTLRLFRGQPQKIDRTQWRLGVGLVYATGQPITTTSSIYFTNLMPDQDYYRGYNLYPTDRNSFRLPPYARLDLSLRMERKYKNWTLAPFLQIFNIGYRKNVWFIEYDDVVENNTVKQEISTFKMFPILPTIGVDIIF